VIDIAGAKVSEETRGAYKTIGLQYNYTKLVYVRL